MAFRKVSDGTLAAPRVRCLVQDAGARFAGSEAVTVELDLDFFHGQLDAVYGNNARHRGKG